MNDDLLAGRYRYLTPLGSGAMGEVWLAEDVLLHRRVAVKRIRVLPGGTDPHALERMVREARLAARLDHPHAVVVHDLVVVGDAPHLVMQYVAGHSLESRIAESGQLDTDEAARIVGQVAGALAHAHGLGIVHRDIKPANILLNADGQAKLADFGIARSSGDGTLTQTGAVIGTPAYLAPEIVRGGTAAPESDVYALGATLYTALEGHPPFGGEGQNSLAVLAQVLTRQPPPPRHAGHLGPLLIGMLDTEPVRRPSAALVAAELGTRHETSRPSTEPEPATRIGPVPYLHADPFAAIRAAIEATNTATSGWSGGFAEWDDIVHEIALGQLRYGDEIQLFLPTLFGLDAQDVHGLPRHITRSLKVLRAGATIICADRFVFVWNGGRTREHGALTIGKHDIRSVEQLEYEEDGEDFHTLVVTTPQYRWPILFSNRHDLTRWREDMHEHLVAVVAVNRR